MARRISAYEERQGKGSDFLFLDWEKAFDKVSHRGLLECLKSYAVPEKYFKIIEFEYNEPQFFVNLDGGRSANHVQHTGIRQGCTLSPFLFLLVMQIIMELVENEVNEKRLEDKFKMKSLNQLEIFSLLFGRRI